MPLENTAKLVKQSPDQPSRVIAVAYPDLYGAGRVFIDAVDAMANAGVSVTVVAPEEGPMLELLAARQIDHVVMPFLVLRKTDLRPDRLIASVLRFPVDLRRIARFLRQREPDCVYTNGLPFAIWFFAGRLMRLRSVCHVHEAEDRVARWLAMGLVLPLLLVDKILANSAHTADWLAGVSSRVGRRTSLLYNGFRFDTDSAPKRLGEPIELVLVGRISRRKGQEVAIRALRELIDRKYAARLRFVGSPFRGYEYVEDELHELADGLNVSDHITFVGQIGSPRSEYDGADIVIVPSLIEPFGNVAIEAMGACRPVVASRVGGLAEIVRDGETGILVEPGNHLALADAIERYINNPSLVARIASCGTADVRRRFAIERFQHEFLEHLLSDSPPSDGWIRRPRRKRGLIVCIVGPDGTGKSTLAQSLPPLLEECRVHHRYWRPGLLPSLRSMSGKPDIGVVTDPHGQGVNSAAKATLRTIYYWLDFLLGHWIVSRRLVKGGGVLLIERGFQDMVVDHRRYMLPTNRLLRLLSPMVPKPDITVILDADPQIVAARKQELTNDEIARQRFLWPRIARSRLQTATFDASQAPEVVAAAVANTLKQWLEESSFRREP